MKDTDYLNRPPKTCATCLHCWVDSIGVRNCRKSGYFVHTARANSNGDLSAYCDVNFSGWQTSATQASPSLPSSVRAIPIYKWQDLPRSMGIYVIKQFGKPHEYIGSAANIRHRIGQHMRDLKSGKHHSPIMQRVYNKSRDFAFSVRIIQFVEDSAQLLAIEQDHIDERQPVMNCAPVSNSCRGVKHTPETCRKRSTASHAVWAGRGSREREEWGETSSKHMRAWWRNATPEQRAAKAETARQNELARIAAFTPKQRAEWQESMRQRGTLAAAGLKTWRKSLTPEQITARKSALKSAQVKWRTENPEAHADAMRRMKETKARKTPEQHAKRLALFRESMRKKKEGGWIRKWKR